MNDICSPMIILIENEADAFWCFERAMRRLVCIYFFSLKVTFTNVIEYSLLCCSSNYSVLLVEAVFDLAF